MTARKTWIKDPEAVLDYEFDWSAWLAVDETISSQTVTVTGATLDSTTATTTSVIAWVSAGTAGTTATIECKIVTSEARTDERTITLRIAER